MKTANDKQVGGDHYKTDYQHWDFLLDMQFGPEYYAGQVTKYITRWQKKHGLRDVRKAQHFVEKMLEIARARGEGWLTRSGPSIVSVRAYLDRFYGVNKVGKSEQAICELVLFARSPLDIEAALSITDGVATEILGSGRTEGAHSGDVPVSVNFEFLGYTEDDTNRMHWKCKACGESFFLELDEPPSLVHTCL